MKITSSTSITSTYGTMLISFMRRRARIASGPRCFVRAREPRLGLTLQDVGELFHEALEAHGEAIDVVGEAVVGDHCGYGREQADRGRDQGLGDPGRMPVVHRALEQRGQIRAAPEVALEVLGPALGTVYGEELEKDEVPGHERHDDEKQHDELNDQARARDHR